MSLLSRLSSVLTRLLKAFAELVQFLYELASHLSGSTSASGLFEICLIKETSRATVCMCVEIAVPKPVSVRHRFAEFCQYPQ